MEKCKNCRFMGFRLIKFSYKLLQQEKGMEEMKEVEEVTHSHVDTTKAKILQEMEVTLS